MNTITIPQTLAKKGDLVVIPREEYEKFLTMKKRVKNIFIEEKDIDSSIKTYKSEKRSGKLKTIKSLADLG
jgi:hypothetical protein